ncbi:MAG: hypothetical protein ACK5P5_01185 [Pseudobdellovibrionaceae bacterium]
MNTFNWLRNIFGILFSLVMGVAPISNAVASDGIVLGTMKANAYNSILKKQLPIDLDFTTTSKEFSKGKVKEVMMCLNEVLVSSCFDLNAKQRAKLVEHISKFEAWSKIAKEKKDRLEKDIGKIVLKKAQFLMNKQWFFQFSTYKIESSFFSQRAGLYQFVMSFPTIQASDNEFIKHNPTTLYFSEEEAAQFKSLLIESSIVEKVTKAVEQKKKVDSSYK